MWTRRGLALGLLLAAVLTGCGSRNDDSSHGVATAAGSPGSPSASPLSDQEQAVKYTQCLRDHGIQVADPENGKPPTIERGTAPKDKLDAAMAACRQYLPTARNRKLDTGQTETLRKVAKCMREHGFPNFPDPDPNQGGIVIPDNSGIDTKSSAFTEAQKQCGMTGAPPSAGVSGGNGQGIAG